jgi:hypothetical protein
MSDSLVMTILGCQLAIRWQRLCEKGKVEESDGGLIPVALNKPPPLPFPDVRAIVMQITARPVRSAGWNCRVSSKSLPGKRFQARNLNCQRKGDRKQLQGLSCSGSASLNKFFQLEEAEVVFQCENPMKVTSRLTMKPEVRKGLLYEVRQIRHR